ncbi:AaceriAEL287Cp [[Ashbya] aceris (nom. inval.)]|nr:AaceriAEL287Cp [[Ashbya] aceris (nom. inval.)]
MVISKALKNLGGYTGLTAGPEVERGGSSAAHTQGPGPSQGGQVVDTDDIDENDESGQNILMSIISQLKPGSDLTRITLPTFILEKKSMLERITNQLQYPEIVLDAHNEKDELLRFVKVVKWYLSGWHIAPKAVKKPLNPVLGEYFTAYWDLPNKQQAFYIAEQTSHHPPKSLYFYMIPESNIRVDGATIPRSKFLGNSTAAVMEGLSVLQFLDIIDPRTGKPEKYTLTQPNMYARGILFGKMRLELGDHMLVKGPRFHVDIEFKTKGFISGTYDAIEGVVKDYNDKTYYEITGKWNDVMYIRDLRVKGAPAEVLFDVHSSEPLKPKVRPIEEQGEYESRRLWKPVTDALAVRDHKVATDEKFKIEDYQRTLAKKRAEEGVEFHPKLFRPVKPGSDLEYYIYKNIPEGEDPEQQIKSILEIAPILPGQAFTEKFSIPAYEKHELQKRESL